MVLKSTSKIENLLGKQTPACWSFGLQAGECPSWVQSEAAHYEIGHMFNNKNLIWRLFHQLYFKLLFHTHQQCYKINSAPWRQISKLAIRSLRIPLRIYFPNLHQNWTIFKGTFCRATCVDRVTQPFNAKLHSKNLIPKVSHLQKSFWYHFKACDKQNLLSITRQVC